MEAEDPLAEVQGFALKEGVPDESAWKPMADLSAFLEAECSQAAVDNRISIDEDSALRTWLFLQIITGHDQTAKNMFYVAKKLMTAIAFILHRGTWI